MSCFPLGTVFSVSMYTRASLFTVFNEFAYFTGIEVIGNGQMSGSHLQEVTLPQSITRIENNAFRYTDLTEITIPAACEYLGADSFQSVPLVSAYVMSTTPPTINSNPFNTSTIRNIYVPAESVALYKETWTRYQSLIQAM